MVVQPVRHIKRPDPTDVIQNLVITDVETNMTVNTAHICVRMRRNGNDHSNLQLRIIGVFTIIPVVIAGVRMNIPKSSMLVDIRDPLGTQSRTRRWHLSCKIYDLLLHGICKCRRLSKQTRRNGTSGSIGTFLC